MEQLQYAYVQAIVAAAGGITMNPQPMDDGIDLQINHRHESHTLNQEQTVRLEVQLKSTTARPVNGHLSAQMSRQRFSQFALSDPQIPRVVVIMQIPRERPHWVFATHRGLSIFHQAYWVNLAGQIAPSGTSERVAVRAPTGQVFDDVALCQMMARVGGGGRP